MSTYHVLRCYPVFFSVYDIALSCTLKSVNSLFFSCVQLNFFLRNLRCHDSTHSFFFSKFLYSRVATKLFYRERFGRITAREFWGKTRVIPTALAYAFPSREWQQLKTYIYIFARMLSANNTQYKKKN